jgi:hypothetical protein
MAGPSDKARFYLEQSAAELNELERKKIFTRVSLPCRLPRLRSQPAGRDQRHRQEALRL